MTSQVRFSLEGTPSVIFNSVRASMIVFLEVQRHARDNIAHPPLLSR